MKETDLLIGALWHSIQRERKWYPDGSVREFRSRYYTDSLPADLQAFKGWAEEVVRELPDEALATDRFEVPDVHEMTRDELRVFLSVCIEERERRDIPDPEDRDEDLEFEAVAWEDEEWEDEEGCDGEGFGFSMN